MSVADELVKLRDAMTGSRREVIQSRPSDREHPDPIPLEMPIGYGGPPSMRELVQEYVEQTLSRQAQSEGLGTFEEEDDFDVDDDEMLDLSGYEVHEYEMVPEGPEGEPVADDPAPPDNPPDPGEEPPEAAQEPSLEPKTPVDKP